MTTRVERRFCLSLKPRGQACRGRSSLGLRAEAGDSRTVARMASVGAAVFVSLDARKDT